MFRPGVFSSLLILAVAVSAEEVALPLGNGVDLTVVKVEAGSFRQGTEADQGRAADETPRDVELSRSFYLGKFPVTKGQFARFAADSGYKTEAEKGTSGGFGWEGGKLVQRKDFNWRNPGFSQTDNDPVVIVTWNDAKAFLSWLSRKTGGAFDLPTEAQWEYACRAGTTTPFANAASAEEVAWYKDNSDFRTHPVGEKELNPWGFGDMLGNVWEWCADWYAPYPQGLAKDPVQQASNLSDKPRRVLRGGSWMKDAQSCRTAARFRNDPASRNPDNGFRVMAFALGKTAALESTATPLPPAVALENQESTPRRLPLAEPQGSDQLFPQPPTKAPSVLGKAYGGLGCFCIGIFVLVYFIRRAFRGGGSTGGEMPSINLPVVPGLPSRAAGRTGGSAPRARIVDDGFFVEGGQVDEGTQLQCRYTAGGAEQSIDLRYEPRPGGQFVYTGQRPTTVSITVIGAAIGSTGDSLFDDRRREEELREARLRDEREERERQRRRDDDRRSAY